MGPEIRFSSENQRFVDQTSKFLAESAFHAGDGMVDIGPRHPQISRHIRRFVRHHCDPLERLPREWLEVGLDPFQETLNYISIMLVVPAAAEIAPRVFQLTQHLLIERHNSSASLPRKLM